VARPARPAATTESVTASTENAARSVLGHVDPLIRRSGMLALVITLFIPLAMALRSGDQPQRAASLAPQVGAAAAAPAAAQGAPVAEAAAASPFANVDIAALPDAVPVNQPVAEPAPATAAPASAEPTSVVAPVADAPATPTATSVPAAARTEQAPSHRATCKRTYTIVSGDAWVLIAKKVGVSTKALLAANNATRRTALYPGRTLCLPSGASAPTTAAPVTTAAASSAPPTTAKPAAPPTTVATRPVNTYTKAQAEQIIRDVWPDELEDHAVFLAKRESHLTPNVNNFCCYGLFQIYFNVHKKWLAQMGVTSAAQLWDPRVNAYAALVLYNRAGGFGPWGG
jgi:LysM repeat protein